jgi:hypothetical protein
MPNHAYDESAFAFSASNSAWSIAPLSSRLLAWAISAAAPSPPGPATDLTYSLNCACWARARSLSRVPLS